MKSLSAAAGMPQRTGASYLAGTEPTRPALIKLARAAKVSVGWLVAGEGPMEFEDGYQPEKHKVYPAVVVNAPPAGSGLGIKEILPVFDQKNKDRTLHFGRTVLWAEMDLARANFPHSNLTSLAACTVNDATLQPAVMRGEWVVIDTSRRELFDGLGAFRMGADVKIRPMHLIESAKDGKAAVFQIGANQRADNIKPLYLTDAELGATVDLLGEVIFAGRLRADGQAMRRS